MHKPHFTLISISQVLIFHFILLGTSFAQAPIELTCSNDTTVCVKGTDCWTSVFVERPEANTVCINGDELEYFIDGTFGLGEFPEEGIVFDFVEPSIYELSVIVINNCEDTVSCNYMIEVLDCALPIPVCVTDIVAALSMEEPPTVTIGAEDLNADSYDACSTELQFSFSADLNDVNITFGEADIGLQPIQLWVTDGSGNQSFCETTVDIQFEINANEEVWNENSIRLQPNLIQAGSTVSLFFEVEKIQDAELHLYNSIGQNLNNEKITIPGGAFSKSLEMPKESGLYYLQISFEGRGAAKVFRIIVQ